MKQLSLNVAIRIIKENTTKNWQLHSKTKQQNFMRSKEQYVRGQKYTRSTEMKKQRLIV